MKTVNIHEAKTHLSKLIDGAVNGEPFVIAKAGKPVVRVEALDEKAAPTKTRLGFLQGRFKVPEDFDSRGQEEIESRFDDPSEAAAWAEKARQAAARGRGRS